MTGMSFLSFILGCRGSYGPLLERPERTLERAGLTWTNGQRDLLAVQLEVLMTYSLQSRWLNRGANGSANNNPG
jgi:hypothetical protein